MAVEPGGLKDQLVTAAADGELKFIDFRVLGEGNTAGSSGESAFAMRPPSNSGSGTSGKSLLHSHESDANYSNGGVSDQPTESAGGRTCLTPASIRLVADAGKDLHSAKKAVHAVP